MSSTHYFLLAPKPSTDRHSSPPLASVKPFDPRADHSQTHRDGKSTFFVGKKLSSMSVCIVNPEKMYSVTTVELFNTKSQASTLKSRLLYHLIVKYCSNYK